MVSSSCKVVSSHPQGPISHRWFGCSGAIPQNSHSLSFTTVYEMLFIKLLVLCGRFQGEVYPEAHWVSWICCGNSYMSPWVFCNLEIEACKPLFSAVNETAVVCSFAFEKCTREMPQNDSEGQFSRKCWLSIRDQLPTTGGESRPSWRCWVVVVEVLYNVSWVWYS